MSRAAYQLVTFTGFRTNPRGGRSFGKCTFTGSGATPGECVDVARASARDLGWESLTVEAIRPLAAVRS